MTFFLVSLISMLIMLGVLVLVHEFGHFIVAKACGVRVETFSVGFGKRLFGMKYGDTDYRLSLLPLGGYVKMAGELPIESATGDPGEYASHPRWQRILIACAGPAANFVLAMLLLMGVYMGHNEVFNYLSEAAVVDYVQPGSAAATAGLQSGDQIVRFDTVENPTWEQIYVHSILNLNHPVSLAVEQNGTRRNLILQMKGVADPDNFTFQAEGFTPVEQKTPLKVGIVEGGMPGAQAGLRSGDEIVSIDGMRLHALTSMVLYLNQNGGKAVTLEILRNGQPLTLTVTPQKATGPDGQPTYKIGFSTTPPPSHIERLSFPKATAQAFHECLKESTLIFDVLHRVLTNQMSVRTLSGPVGIARETGYIAALPGWAPLLSETATISLNLGILNLLPIPILDGGVILFLLIEIFMRRDLNEKFKERVYQAAFVFIILMTVFVLFNDLSKIPTLAKLKL